MNSRGENLHDYLFRSSLVILNRGMNGSTFMDCKRQEVIDITVGRERMASIVRDWKVAKEPSGSDHKQIRLFFRHHVKSKWVRNSKRTDREGYITDLEAKMKQSSLNFHSKQQLDEIAASLASSVRESFELNCKLRPTCRVHGVPWWNNSLAKLRAKVRKAFSKARNSSLRDDLQISTEGLQQRNQDCKE